MWRKPRHGLGRTRNKDKPTRHVPGLPRQLEEEKNISPNPGATAVASLTAEAIFSFSCSRAFSHTQEKLLMSLALEKDRIMPDHSWQEEPSPAQNMQVTPVKPVREWAASPLPPFCRGSPFLPLCLPFVHFSGPRRTVGVFSSHRLSSLSRSPSTGLENTRQSGRRSAGSRKGS